MPRLKNRPPKLSKDKNYAIVYCNGVRLSMGKWGTPEAEKNYRRFLAEWAQSNQSASRKVGHKTSVGELSAAYLDFAEVEKEPKAYGHIKTAIAFVVGPYSEIDTDRFGPKALAAVQKEMEMSGRFSRGYVNDLVGWVRSAFRWGVGQEMVPAEVETALKYVAPLRKGKTTARESVPREDVPDEIVWRTLPYLFPTVAAMVKVQRYACMRPSEVCRMRVGDIDRSGEIWFYRPGLHKGAWRGHEKSVALGKPEQEIIAPRLVGKSPEQAVFSPRETMLEKKERDAAGRKTKVQPSQVKRAERRAARSKSRVGEFYNASSYRNSIEYAIQRANKELSAPIPHWTPYQLRHSAITEITFENNGNRDVARAVAGQKSISVTQRYNHADVRIAVEQAKKRSSQ